MNKEDIWLVSACLLGECCRYDGKAKASEKVKKFLEGKKYFPVCPEKMGGLSIPRQPAEITGGTGDDVLQGRAEVVAKDGSIVTCAFLSGAYEVLAIAQKYNAKKALFKANSPSCGNSQICDGTFSGKKIRGRGVAAALLMAKGIEVLSEKDID